MYPIKLCNIVLVVFEYWTMRFETFYLDFGIKNSVDEGLGVSSYFSTRTCLIEGLEAYYFWID